MTETRYVTQAETNKMIRAALRDAFPGVKFSVTGSGGNATNVRWVDGPDEKRVEDIARRFEGKSFDGMQDLESVIITEIDGQRVHFGASYVFCRRSFSAEVQEAAEAELVNAGIDPHGRNSLPAVPAFLCTAHPELDRLLWNGYSADGPLLARVIAADIADARFSSPVVAA